MQHGPLFIPKNYRIEKVDLQVICFLSHMFEMTDYGHRGE